MKYFALLFGFLLLLIGAIYYVFSIAPNSQWKIDKTLLSPDKKVMAVVSCNRDGGATVGFYCKLFLKMNDKEYEVMMTRTDQIDIEWITSNVLSAKVNDYSKIYDFTSVYWNQKTESEYFVKLDYK